jgi:hypothetical protein
MAGFLLLYERLQTHTGSWQPMLQHQAVVAVARAVLTHGTSQAPELSDDILFAPLNLDILPLLAMTASDFAEFAEPEASERPRTPIRLYDDGSWEDDREGADELRHLLHQSWFERLNLDLAGTIREFRPENGVILGDPRQIVARDGELLSSFNRIVYFNHLVTELPVLLPVEMIAADALLERSIEGRISEAGGEPAARMSMWDAMLREEPPPDLEPFVRSARQSR